MKNELFEKSIKQDDSQAIPNVLITGFGPFRNHSTNPSWLTVKELLNLNTTEYNLIAKEIPVDYDVVTEVVPRLWNDIQPKLVVHCGVSDLANCVTIEKVAHRDKYLSCDVKGCVPQNNSCCNEGPEVLSTAIDVDRVVKEVSASDVCVKAEASENAGRYLCEFIYYASLKISRNTVFIHVPPVDKPYSARAMAQTIAVIISSILKQLQ